MEEIGWVSDVLSKGTFFFLFKDLTSLFDRDDK